MTKSLTVVKVGGSLFNLPDLASRLRAWLDREVSGPALLVPGGGQAVEALRRLDRAHRLGQEACHWLALRLVTVNAHLLAALLDEAEVSGDLASWTDGCLRILDAYAFARDDEGRPGALPHQWEVSSDSVAARAAVVFEARQLWLLKSTNPPAGGWEAAAREGLVDAHFSRVIPPNLAVRLVNLRAYGTQDD
jgi:aspartokinase-like uncharacterized kinase